MRSYRPLVLLTVFTVLTAIVSMGVGHYPVSPLAVIDVLWSAVTGRPTSQPSVVANVVLVVRLPRVLAAILVGAGLAAAGAAYQTLFRNPLASPAILGVSAGAGFGAALAMLLHAGALAVQGSAFLGGLFAVGAAMFIAGRLGKGTSLVLVLAGLVVSALFQALTSALKYVADPLDTLPTIVFWLPVAAGDDWQLGQLGLQAALHLPIGILEEGGQAVAYRISPPDHEQEAVYRCHGAEGRRARHVIRHWDGSPSQIGNGIPRTSRAGERG